MVRKGYSGEYRAKGELEKEWGRGNVIKVAIGGAQDYIIASGGELIEVLEIKEIHITPKKKKWYPTPREKDQIKRIIRFAKQHFIPAELWIYEFRGSGKPVIKRVRYLYKPRK